MLDRNVNPKDSNAPRVIVIGGGATGCAVARDLVLRDFQVTLVEFGDLASGTSSRFHGMLQSGARYAVSDTDYAAECMRERDIVARLIPDAVEPRGGLFVSLPEDPPDFAKRFQEGCRQANIPVEELDPELVLHEEANISRDVRTAFAVPDASINPWHLTGALAEDIRLRGGKILTRAQVTEIIPAPNNGNTRVRVAHNDRNEVLETDIVVNATGSWSSRVAELVGQEVNLQLTKGSIIVFGHRVTRRIINRCRPPSSNDIVVPTGTVSLFGTTSRLVDDPDVTRVEPEEIQELLEGAEPLIPGIRNYRALRAWAGVRPLVKLPHWPSDKPLSRRHQVIDHSEQGLRGFFTVCGGSLTTHRSMAKDLGDRLCLHLGLEKPCLTATTALGSRPAGDYWRPTARYEASERRTNAQASLCECEQVSLDTIKRLIETNSAADLHGIRCQTRLGFGPCQGIFCANRAASLMAEKRPNAQVLEDLESFWLERLKGMTPTAWNEQARQTLLSDQIHRSLLGIRLPSEAQHCEDQR